MIMIIIAVVMVGGGGGVVRGMGMLTDYCIIIIFIVLTAY